MNREDALNWLVNNIVAWYSQKAPEGYWWVNSPLGVFLVSKGAPDMEVITKQCWLKAIEIKLEGTCV